MLNKDGVLSKFSMAVAGVLALAVTAIATPAAATNWRFDPAPNTFHLTGILQLEQSITIFCNVKIDVSVDAKGVATVTSRTFSNGTPGVTSPLCGGVVQPFGTWTLAPNGSDTEVTATVGSSSILGSCVGSILGAWSNANQTVTFTGASVPGTPGPCTVNGTLTSDDPSVRIVHN